jgi:hypothetical protein
VGIGYIDWTLRKVVFVFVDDKGREDEGQSRSMSMTEREIDWKQRF